MSRSLISAGGLVLSGLPALAGGFGCVSGDCYTPTYVPPTYGAITEKVMTRAPETYAITTPPQYGTVYDTVRTGGGRYWSVTRDPHTGRLVGCWVTKPVTYASVPRTVMVSPGSVTPYAVPAQYGYRQQIVQTSPGYKAWAPVSRHVSYGGYADGGYDPFQDGPSYRGGYGGGSYGYGFGGRRVGGYGHSTRRYGLGGGVGGHRQGLGGGFGSQRHGGFGGHGGHGGKHFAGRPGRGFH